MYDYSKLKGKIREVMKNDANCAELLGIAQSTMSGKLNGVIPISLSEMDKLIETLGISTEEIYEYFFTKKVEKSST